MRPAGIVWFEWLNIATLVLGVFNSWLAWPHLVAMRGSIFLVTTQLLTFAIFLGLILFVSRRRSNVAKWIMIALFVLGLPLWFQHMSSGPALGSVIISLIQIAAQVVAYALLFTDSSRRWFKS